MRTAYLDAITDVILVYHIFVLFFRKSYINDQLKKIQQHKFFLQQSFLEIQFFFSAADCQILISFQK